MWIFYSIFIEKLCFKRKNSFQDQSQESALARGLLTQLVKNVVSASPDCLFRLKTHLSCATTSPPLVFEENWAAYSTLMLAGRSLPSRKCKFFLNPIEKHPFGHVCMKKDLYLYPGRTNVSYISLQTWRSVHMNMRNKKGLVRLYG